MALTIFSNHTRRAYAARRLRWLAAGSQQSGDYPDMLTGEGVNICP
jgi:hypothetical protein